jgi:hypothetical protein
MCGARSLRPAYPVGVLRRCSAVLIQSKNRDNTLLSSKIGDFKLNVKLFGTTIQETLKVLAGAAGGPRKVTRTDQIVVIARMAISLLFILVGAYFVVADTHQSQSIGAGILGAVTGYWLK